MQIVQKLRYQKEDALEKKLGISQARKQFADLVDQVQYQNDTYVIIRRGKPTAALVPIEVYENWKKDRYELFEMIRKIQEANAGADPDEVFRDVLTAQKAVRSQVS
jgi:prevent-host-death family protein